MTRPTTLQLTTDEVRILRRYAAGADLADIATETGIDRGDVGDILSERCHLNRGRARELMRTHDANRPPAPPSPNGTPTTAPSAAPPPPEDTVQALLRRARDAGDRRSTTLADKLAALITELTDHLTATAAEREARARVADLERQLAEARAQLPTAKRSAPRREETGGGLAATPAQIRTWAAANNIPCGSIGRVPRDVADAYQRAHNGGA